MVNAAITA